MSLLDTGKSQENGADAATTVVADATITEAEQLEKDLSALDSISDEDFLKEHGGNGSNAPLEEDLIDYDAVEVLGDATLTPEAKIPDAKEKAEAEDKGETKEDEAETKLDEDKAKTDTGITLDEFTIDSLGDPATSLKEIFKPFKASGSEFQPTSVNEIIALMQKGVDYSKKTNELAKFRDRVAFLDENKLTEEDLSYFMDLRNRDPKAIAKLLKDSETDLLNVDVDEESEGYVPNDYSIDKQKVALASTLNDLTSTSTYKDLVENVNNVWDTNSQEALLEDPSRLNTISQHMEQGIYESVVKEIDRAKVLGHIPESTPFLQAYKQVGTAMFNAGAFSDQATDTDEANLQETDQTTLVDKQKLEIDKTATDNLRKQAANTGTAPKPKPTAKPSLASELTRMDSMSDEDFLKEFGAT